MHTDGPVSHRVCTGTVACRVAAAIFGLCEHMPEVYRRTRDVYTGLLREA